MTKKQWFKIFKQELEVLPCKERRSAIEYYRELYDEKLEAGLTEAEILRSFNAPALVVQEILLSSKNITDMQDIERVKKKVLMRKKILGVLGYMALIVLTGVILCLAVYIALNSIAAVLKGGSIIAVVVLFVSGAVAQFTSIAFLTLIIYGIYRVIKSFKKSKEVGRDDEERMV